MPKKISEFLDSMTFDIDPSNQCPILVLWWVMLVQVSNQPSLVLMLTDKTTNF